MPKFARYIHLLCFLAFASAASGQLPELSSIEPLEFDEESQRVVARGDARLSYGKAEVRADDISLYREYGLAEASGNVEIMHENLRVLADNLSFDVREEILALDLPRTGQWPFYLTAVEGGGTPGDISLSGGNVYYGNPSWFGPNASAGEIQYVDDEETGEHFVRLEDVTLRLGPIPFFYWPGYKQQLPLPLYHIEFGGGADNERGVHAQSTVLAPVSSWLRLGANFDLYSKRGVLAGPAAQYNYQGDNQSIAGALSTGYINDQEDPGLDIRDNTIDRDRGFVDWRHKQHIGNRTDLTGSLTYWSDSEVVRDFRRERFDQNQRPDSFVEGVYAGDNFLLSAFGRIRPDDTRLIQERLPEVRFDYLPTPVFNTGFFHSGSLAYARLREDIGRVQPGFTEDTEADRFDLNYRVRRPFNPVDWLTFTPLAGLRVTHYENQEIDPAALAAFNNLGGPAPLSSDNATREIYEVGFDLEGRAHATYPTENRVWGVDGLRHLVRPVARYRYFSDPEEEDGEIAAIDRRAFDLDRPVLNLSEIRNIDRIRETHLVRLGVENLFQTRAREYGSRDLARLNFYQDVLFETGERFDGGEQDTFNATWVELMLDPAPWLKFDLSARLRTETLTLEELRTRTVLTSGEVWELGFSTDALNKQFDQYRIDFRYRLNERHTFLSDLRLEAKSGNLDEASFGLRSRISSAWELIYAITFRDGARRESDVEFTIRATLATP